MEPNSIPPIKPDISPAGSKNMGIKYLLIGLLTLVLTSLVLFGIYAAGMWSQRHVKSDYSKQKAVLAEQGWKLYRNDAYGFEFMYPPNSVIDEREWIVPVEHADNAPEIKVIVTVKQGLEDAFSVSVQDTLSNSPPASSENTTFLIRDSQLFTINSFGGLKAINKTFMLLDPQINTTGWKTYRNDKYGFSLMLPPSWEGTIANEFIDDINTGHELEGEDAVSIGFPEARTMFLIYAFDRDEWNRQEKLHANDPEDQTWLAPGGENVSSDDKIGENNKYIFVNDSFYGNINDRVTKANLDLYKIFPTFKTFPVQ